MWEGEPNDQAPSQANGPLVSGLTYYGVFPSGADVQDYYYIDLSAAHAVELWLTNIPAGQDYNLVLRNALLQTVGYHLLGQQEESVSALSELGDLTANRQAHPLLMFIALVRIGADDSAFQLLQQAIDSGMSAIHISGNAAIYTDLFDNPRGEAFLESIGRSQETLDAIEFEVTLPQ